MQNAPAMLAQKMMNRQAPYGPIGMVSQNMSGNKKGSAAAPTPYAGPVIFDSATATSGLTFSTDLTTVTNNSASGITSAKLLYPKSTGKWYVEFIKNSSSADGFGIGLNSYVCNTTNTVGNVPNTFGYYSNGLITYEGTPLGSVAPILNGNRISVAYDLTGGSVQLSLYKNGVLQYGPVSSWVPAASIPIWSSATTSTSAIVVSTSPLYVIPGFTYLGPT